jgi:phage I-like protein
MSRARANQILNRNDHLPADRWYMVARRGEHPIALEENGRRIVLLQIVDETACEAMVNRFREALEADPAYQPLVDYDHFSEDTENSSEAAGWITALDNRDDGLYAQIEWTDTGAAAVNGKRFRFLSPVWHRKDCDDLGNRRIRPMRLDRAAVTNDPNIRGIRPLINRAENGATEPAEPAGDPRADTGGKESSMDYKAELLAMLGLPAEASDEEVAKACAARKDELANSQAAAEAAAKAAAEEKEQLKNRAEQAEAKLAEHERKTLETDVEKDLDEFKDRFTNREEVKAQLLANRAGTRKLLEAMKPIPGLTEPLRNRKDAKAPEPLVDNAAVINRKVQEYRAANRCSFDQAWDAVRASEPELFRKS